MFEFLLLLGIVSSVSSKTLRGGVKGDAPAVRKSGACDISLVSFAIVAVVIGAICFGAYTFFKRRSSREVRQAEEPLLVVGD